MPFKRGESGNPNGRPRGSINKVSTAVRDRVIMILDGLYENIEDDLELLSAKERIDTWLKLLEFALPKLQRTELSNTFNMQNDMTEEEISAELDRLRRDLKESEYDPKIIGHPS